MPESDKLPQVKTIHQLGKEYAAQVQQSDVVCVDLGDWLPSFRGNVRPLVPGELCFIMADAGVGKSMALQNICLTHAEGTVFFEMELPGTLLYERWQAAINKVPAAEIEARAKRNEVFPTGPLQHILTCDATRLNTDMMARVIEDVRERLSVTITVVCVDYIGLMTSASASSRSRYERVSLAAEDLKALAKTTGTVVFAATQVNRDKERVELDMHDAKDSGAIEASAGLLLAMWRDLRDTTGKTLMVKVCKNTKGRAGQIITCNIDGAKMLITERAMPFESDRYAYEGDNR